uniref:Uncharacterized protein n=1 Tax=Nelumbo nucifera TaxID=4432 RepID=A0A822XWG0_NELNU|nr:TPA_asm: hypothetical protein HUJ06_026134 [Nelumbo nucifera]
MFGLNRLSMDMWHYKRNPNLFFFLLKMVYIILNIEMAQHRWVRLGCKPM